MNRPDKEFWKMYNDPKISSFYKHPRKSRDLAYTLGMAVFIMAAITFVIATEDWLNVERETNAEIKLDNLKDFVLNHSNCDQLKELVEGANDWQFMDQAQAKYLVRCI